MSYFDNLMTKPEETIDSICHALRNPRLGVIDFIAGMGVSGTLPLVPVSIKTRIPFVAVRKKIDRNTQYENGGSHSGATVETSYDFSIANKRYVIIDDFVDSGSTLCDIEETLKLSRPSYKQECVGVILYQGSQSRCLSYQTSPELSDQWSNIVFQCLSDDILELSHLLGQKRLLAL